AVSATFCSLVILTAPRAHPRRHALPLHDALPIFVLHRGARGPGRSRVVDHSFPLPGYRVSSRRLRVRCRRARANMDERSYDGRADRMSTRLNSSHVKISYAVFCLKKKKRLITTDL